MSLHVPSALLDRAHAGQISDEDFLTCIQQSLPYAWNVISEVAERAHHSSDNFAEDNSAPPTDHEQGQLLRALASSSMRHAMQRHFGVTLEFQNCCKVAAFAPQATNGPTHREFVSPRAQLLNQAPELVNC